MFRIAYLLITFTWLFIFAATVKVFAEEKLTKYDFYVQELPAVCGTQDQVNQYIENNGYIVLNYSLGRANSEKDGDPVFVLAYYVNEDASQSMATVQVPNSDQTCILYITFDLIHNEEELKEGEKI